MDRPYLSKWLGYHYLGIAYPYKRLAAGPGRDLASPESVSNKKSPPSSRAAFLLRIELSESESKLCFFYPLSNRQAVRI